MPFTQTASQQEKPVLEATTHDVRHVANVLRGVSFKPSQKATINILSAGISVIVEDARTMFAQAILPHSIFDAFNFNPPETESQDDEAAHVSFEVDLSTLLTVLDIFGTAGPLLALNSGATGRGKKGKWGSRDDEGEFVDPNPAGVGIERFFERTGKTTGMRMTYMGTGHPVSLTLSEDASGPVTTCNITTLEPETSFELPFDDNDKLIKVIMKSSWLSEALSELDTSCDKLTIVCSPPTVPLPSTSIGTDSQAQRENFNRTINNDGDARPYFRLLGVGAYGTTEIDYPNDRDVLQAFECEEPIQYRQVTSPTFYLLLIPSSSYRFSHVAKISKALQGSIRTSMRINDTGVLSIQLMMPMVRARNQDSSNPFIEFRCLALDDAGSFVIAPFILGLDEHTIDSFMRRARVTTIMIMQDEMPDWLPSLLANVAEPYGDFPPCPQLKHLTL
ncbi:ssDNA endodeoxyribonuclease, partial [Tulasnella sp. 403]